MPLFDSIKFSSRKGLGQMSISGEAEEGVAELLHGWMVLGLACLSTASRQASRFIVLLSHPKGRRTSETDATVEAGGACELFEAIHCWSVHRVRSDH